jgi:hypothetical protein
MMMVESRWKLAPTLSLSLTFISTSGHAHARRLHSRGKRSNMCV